MLDKCYVFYIRITFGLLSHTFALLRDLLLRTPGNLNFFWLVELNRTKSNKTYNFLLSNIFLSYFHVTSTFSISHLVAFKAVLKLHGDIVPRCSILLTLHVKINYLVSKWSQHNYTISTKMHEIFTILYMYYRRPLADQIISNR